MAKAAWAHGGVWWCAAALAGWAAGEVWCGGVWTQCAACAGGVGTVRVAQTCER